MTTRTRIGIDLGGHKIAAARINIFDQPDQSGGLKVPTIERSVREETPKGRGIADVMSALAAIVVDLSGGGDRPECVGVALPSMIDADRRHSRKMPNFPPEWDDLDVPAALERLLAARGYDLPVRIENDANCYALGEGAAGEAIGAKDYVVFTMGTGIGSGIVLGGRLLTGAHGMAGEMGHVVILGEAPCGCGGKGHTETLAAADGTRKRAEAAGLPGGFRDLWALRGKPEADAVIEVVLDAMARTVATAYHTIDPELVVIGGGMSSAPRIEEAIAERAVPYLSRPFKHLIDVRASKLGNTAALFGAASI